MTNRCIFCHSEGATLLLNRHGAYAHQSCFNRDDDADQAAMFAAMAIPVFAPDVLEAGVAMRLARQVEDLTDRRFGRLTAIRLEPVLRPGRPTRREWLLRCDCGAELHASASRIRRGEPRACASCAHAARGERLRGRCPANRTPRSPGVVPQAGRPE